MNSTIKLIAAFALVVVSSHLFVTWAGKMHIIFPVDPAFAVLGVLTFSFFVVAIVVSLVESALSDVFILGQKAGQDMMFKIQQKKNESPPI